MQQVLKKIRREPLLFAVVVTIFLVVGFFVLFPLLKIIALSLTKDGSFSFATYRYIFEKSWLRRSLTNSLLLGCVTASCAVTVGYLFALIETRTRSRFNRVLRWMATLTIISPPFMLTLSIILLFGKNGFITRSLFELNNFNIYGLGGLVLAQTVVMFPLAYLNLVGVLRSIDSTLEDASLDLSASRLRTFYNITFKLSLPGVVSSWLLVFVTSLADFANPMILAGKFDVLSVQAYLQFTGMGNHALGAALSIVLLVPSLAGYFLQKYYLRKRTYVTVTGKPQRLRTDLISTNARRFLVSLALGISMFIALLYFTVLAGCFTKAWGIHYEFSLANFAYVFKVGWATFSSTLYLSALATPFTVLIGMFIAFIVVRRRFPGRNVLDTLSMLPFALPGTVVGIGYILAFNQAPLVLTGTAAIIVLCFVFRNLPVAIEATKASLMQIDRSIEEAAVDLGANSFRVFHEITVPMIKPAAFAGLAYVFVHCMTAVSAVIFLVSAKWNHLTVLILSQTEVLRFSAAAVLCLILIVTVLTVFWLMRRMLKLELLERGAS